MISNMFIAFIYIYSNYYHLISVASVLCIAPRANYVNVMTTVAR